MAALADHVVEMTERRHSATRSRRSGAELKVYVEFCYLNGAGREVPIKINETTDRGLLRFSRDFLLLHLFFCLFSFSFLFYDGVLVYLIGGFYTYLHRDYKVTDVSLAVVAAIEIALGLA